MQQPIWIYGAGGMGKETYWLIEQYLLNTWVIKGFIDDYKQTDVLLNLPLINSVQNNSHCVIAIADGRIRKLIAEKNKETIFSNIIHPDIHLHKSITIGNGNILSKGAVLTLDITIGNHVIININSTIGHDCVIEDFVSIMFGAHISGNVKIGEGTLIGSGAVVLPNITIGKWCRIGAGAVITKDIPDNCTVVGVPGRIIKYE